MNTMNKSFAAALIAYAAFWTAASAAEGEYYGGAGGSSRAVRTPGIDLFTTQGITPPLLPRAMTDSSTINSGDFYEGANRYR